MKEFAGYRIDFHNFHYARDDIKALDLSFIEITALLEKITGKPLSVEISAREAETTLLYLVKQWFDPMYETFNLKDAHQSALDMIAKYPWNFQEYAVKYDKDGMPIIEDAPVTDDDGEPVAKQRKGFKKERALALYREHRDVFTERKDWVDFLVLEIPGMTKGTANVYMSNIESGKWAV